MSPKCHKYPEKYAHHLLFMFYHFRNKENLKSSNLGTFSEKLQQPAILDTVNRNKQFFEPYGDLVESTLLNLSIEKTFNQDVFLNMKITK